MPVVLVELAGGLAALIREDVEGQRVEQHFAVGHTLVTAASLWLLAITIANV